MSEIGYYNYYNNVHRYSPETVQDRYQQMVDNWNSDDLKSKSEDSNPYSDLNLSRRALDEKLADWASSMRSQCKTEVEVHQYLSKKYFGTDDFAYTKKWDEPEKYAMFKNDYNAVCFGTIGCGDLDDPRLNYTSEDWDTYEVNQIKSKHDSISLNMSNLLKNNGINLSDNDNLLITFNPYDFNATVSGLDDINLLSQIANLINNKNNSKNLMYYAVNSSSGIDNEVVNKFRAYQQVKEFTGLDLSQLNLKDGEYYTSDGQSLYDLLKDGIENSSVGIEFKGAAFDYAKSLIDRVASKGWNSINDLNISIGYNNRNGFFTVGNNNWEV